MAFKTFVNGTNLPASDVNDYLMKQSVMTFASSAARASALTVPTEGMTVYLQDTNQVEIYDGSTWRPEAGLALLNKTDFTSVASVTVSNVFSSLYDSYQLVYNFAQNGTGNSSVQLTLTSGGVAAASNWAFGNFTILASGYSTNTVGSGQSGLGLADTSTGTKTDGSLIINLPAVATQTFVHGNAMSTSSGNGANDGRFINGLLANTSTYDGVRLLTSANNMTGTIRIYGLRNI